MLNKTLGRARMNIQEASEDFIKRGIMFPGPKTTYIEANTQTDGKTENFGPKNHFHAPKACTMHLRHRVCAQSTEKVRGKTDFSCFFVGKARFLGRTSGENFPNKYYIPHSPFLIQNWSTSIGRRF